eukprot:TRINITY_DN6493_c0_g1_i1.p1 TRINITY_DN6493_c0_g1~~TRINITY_DN6493_c0_g1_i1.p1  ORF type:complete len:188 (+),score=25.45 TRINITY_DN6493_c0_g1_i1:370-933(+)
MAIQAIDLERDREVGFNDFGVPLSVYFAVKVCKDLGEYHYFSIGVACLEKSLEHFPSLRSFIQILNLQQPPPTKKFILRNVHPQQLQQSQSLTNANPISSLRSQPPMYLQSQIMEQPIPSLQPRVRAPNFSPAIDPSNANFNTVNVISDYFTFGADTSEPLYNLYTQAYEAPSEFYNNENIRSNIID